MPANLGVARTWGKALLRFFGSLKLAVILLMVLIIATAVGTICESRFDAKVARAYVYDAPWFNAWMILLGINLAAAAFTRYPWKKHHTGFVITHAGIITLLFGAVIGRIWGIEGTMTLFEGTQPSNRLLIDEQEVRIQEGAQTSTFPVGIKYRHPSPSQPILLGTTPGGWKIDVTDYAEHLLPVSIAQPVTEGGNPAVQIRLWSGTMQQVQEWLWPNDPDNSRLDLGLLSVECRRGPAPPMIPAHIGGTHPSSNQTPDLQKITGLPPGDRAVIGLGDDGKISYYLQNKAGATSGGFLEPGKPISTSWGNWQMEVVQVLRQAVPSTDFQPIAKGAKIPPRDRANLTEGIKVRLSKDGITDDEWLGSGWQMDLPGAKQTMQASYGPRIFPMPISLELKQFEVERNEGLDTPAGFKSTLMVRDAVGNSATGSCSMNEPMNFPDEFWRRWTGLTYKISQASWNPENLHQSSVQILLDPAGFLSGRAR